MRKPGPKPLLHEHVRDTDDVEPGDLDELVRELDRAAPVTARRGSVRLDGWLERLRAERGSDMYLIAGLPPAVRVDGLVRRLDEPALGTDEI